jgi:hypothetical protein
MTRHLLIAETDDGGDVVCVWWLPEGGRHPRPIGGSMHAGVVDLAAAEFHGAPEPAIRGWIDRQRA